MTLIVSQLPGNYNPFAVASRHKPAYAERGMAIGSALPESGAHAEALVDAIGLD